MHTFTPSFPPFRFVLALLVIEVASFFGWVFPEIAWVMLAYIVCRIGVVSLKDLRVGIIAVCVELVIGSQGYLFAVPTSGFTVSLRLALFCAVFLASLIHCARDKKIYLFGLQFFPYLAAVLLCIAYGVMHSMLAHLPLRDIFFDTNAWLFLGLALPFAQALRSRADVLYILKYVFWGLIWLAFKTIFFMFIFSHPDVFDIVAPHLYRWLRDLRIAEIFRFPSGFARVFIQSHVFALFGFALVYIAHLASSHKPSKRSLAILFLLILTILLSYSRTFWLVAAAVMGVSTLYIFVSERVLWKQHLRRISEVIGLSICAVLCVLVLVKVPLPGAGTTSGNLLTERVSGTSQEVAAVTRFQQFAPLLDAALKQPVFGSGFGSTVTYTSEDPKVRAQHPDGKYTTYAFEWAYLDLWYKIGIVGVIIIIGSLLALCVKLFKEYRATNDPLTLGLCVSLILLLGVHVFTPYINHPLGLGWVLLVALYVSTSPKKV